MSPMSSVKGAWDGVKKEHGYFMLLSDQIDKNDKNDYNYDKKDWRTRWFLQKVNVLN